MINFRTFSSKSYFRLEPLLYATHRQTLSHALSTGSEWKNIRKSNYILATRTQHRLIKIKSGTINVDWCLRLLFFLTHEKIQMKDITMRMDEGFQNLWHKINRRRKKNLIQLTSDLAYRLNRWPFALLRLSWITHWENTTIDRSKSLLRWHFI